MQPPLLELENGATRPLVTITSGRINVMCVAFGTLLHKQKLKVRYRDMSKKTTYCFDSKGNELFEGDMVEFDDYRCVDGTKAYSVNDGKVRVRALIEFKNGRFYINKHGLNDKLLEPKGKEKLTRWLPYIYEPADITRLNGVKI